MDGPSSWRSLIKVSVPWWFSPIMSVPRLKVIRVLFLFHDGLSWSQRSCLFHDLRLTRFLFRDGFCQSVVMFIFERWWMIYKVIPSPETGEIVCSFYLVRVVLHLSSLPTTIISLWVLVLNPLNHLQHFLPQASTMGLGGIGLMKKLLYWKNIGRSIERPVTWLVPT